MNSLGIVARACLMEAGRKKEKQESSYRKWGRRAAIGAAIGAGVGAAGALGSLGAVGAYRGFKAIAPAAGVMKRAKYGAKVGLSYMRHPINAAQHMPGAATVGNAYNSLKGAMSSGYAKAANFVGSHTPDSVKGFIGQVKGGYHQGRGRIAKTGNALQNAYNYLSSGYGNSPRLQKAVKYGGRAALGLGAAGLGYMGYKAYKKRAKQAAREAYIATYMNLMEAAEQQKKESAMRKWGRRALYAGGAAAAGLGTLGAYRGYKNAKSGAKMMGMAKGAWGHLTNPFKVAKGSGKLLKRRYQKYMGTYNPTRTVAGQMPGYRGGQVDLSGIGSR